MAVEESPSSEEVSAESQQLTHSEYQDVEEQPYNIIPFEKKIKVCLLVAENPKWSLKTLQAHGAACLKKVEYLKQWREDIQSGGTRYDKMENINSYIGADGQKSKVREAMGCEYISWDYDQMGVVATVKLSEKIENYVAWQRFLPTGPVALLPLTETLSSLVWSTNTDEAKRLLKVTEEEFVDSLNDALWKTYPKNSLVDGGLKSFQQILGSLELQSGTSRQLHPSISKVIEGSRAAFPLGFGHSVQYVQSGVVLIGDAAHRVHPLAGQGVNLGFGDVMELVRVLSESTNNGSYLGDVKYLYEYESLRQRHNIPTMLAIDALHRLYNKTDPSLVLLRSIGLQLTNAINPLKKLLMQHAAGQRII